MSLNRSAAAQFFLDDEDEDLPPIQRSGADPRLRTTPVRSNSSYTSGRGYNPGSARSTSPPIRGKSEGGGQDAFESNDYQDETEVVELLTRAAVTSDDQTKLKNLSRVKDIIINRQPALLDNFLDEMLNFQSDSNPDVRRYILEFIEDACKTDAEIIPKIFPSMLLLLSDPIVSVQKKAIQATAKIYKLTLMWLCRSKTIVEEMENSWSSVQDFKKFILKQIDSDNDGIRTHTVKFIETVILLQTGLEHDSIKRENEFCLDQVPITLRVANARPRKLEEDARCLFEELLKFHGSRHATSVNLMTCMGSIVIIAKLRPSFMGKVVAAMEKLNAILPPTLERSQVTSVRKHMKVQLIGLLKHPRAVDYYDSITNLLTDLGATHSELNKAIPNWDELRSENRKRQRAILEMEEHSARKRARIEVEEMSVPLDDDSDDDDEEVVRVESVKDDRKVEQLSEMEKDIFEQLTPKVVTELVLASMSKLPDVLPAHFMASFTPVAIAGTESQKRHVSRLLAAQITAFQMGAPAALQAGGYVNDLGVDNDDLESIVESRIPTLVSSAPPPAIVLNAPLNKLFLAPPVAPGKKKPMKAVKLSELTKPLSADAKQYQLMNSVKRILDSGEFLNDVKCQLISAIVTSSAFELRYYVMNFIKEDLRSRIDLGMCWVFSEYSLWQGFVSKSIPVMQDKGEDRYEWTFFNLMKGILEHQNELEKSTMTWRLFTEPPTIPDKGLDLLKTLCGQTFHAAKGMQLLLELTLKRPKKLHYLSALLEFCSHSNEEIRTSAIRCVIKLFEGGMGGVKVIEDKAIHTYLSSLRHASPPEILFAENLGRQTLQLNWNDELVRSCLHLYMELLVVKNSLINELAKVYVETPSDVKRNILRFMEPYIKKMGTECPDLMSLIDAFPKGAETLITRIIHVLTDKVLPSADLVDRVRTIYSKRAADVRFLIPVLNGLTKAEIIAALPKLIKLNPQVVKEVFNRLLGIHADRKAQHTSPVSPVELMLALHNIEQSKCDVKTVIKATSLCFNETDVFTAEVLAVVINQLLDQSPIPTLLMRTVIQTLALHSKLSGFIMNTLTRLVQKQVWTEPKIWEGFIKCCQRAMPKSLPVLLTLPPNQLKQALIEAPDLHEPIVNHLMSFSEQQRACMHPLIINAVLGNVKSEVMIKNEYEDFDDEVEDLHYNNQKTIHRMKAEQRSPGREDMTGLIKGEPMDYNN